VFCQNGGVGKAGLCYDPLLHLRGVREKVGELGRWRRTKISTCIALLANRKLDYPNLAWHSAIGPRVHLCDPIELLMKDSFVYVEFEFVSIVGHHA